MFIRVLAHETRLIILPKIILPFLPLRFVKIRVDSWANSDMNH